MGVQNQRALAPSGQLVDVGGFCLHALVRGEGTPTVLLEPALGGFALQYAQIQSAVSVFTRVMAYDRAGQGWSDVSPNPRTPVHLERELTALLAGWGLEPPYILVGHSFGGLQTLIYAAHHPEQIVGVVLVDSTHPDEYDVFPDIDKNIAQMRMAVGLQKFVSRLGLGRQLARLSLGSAAKSLSKEDLATFVAIASQPKHQETMLAEFCQHRCYYGAQSEVPRTMGDMPLIVVTAGKSVSGRAKVGGSLTGDEMNVVHQQLQEDLVRLSTQGEQVIVPDATHFSIFSQPEHAAQVVAAIRRLVDRARTSSPVAANISPA